MAKGFKCGFDFLDVLPQSKAEQIHIATLKILKKTGVKISDKETLEMLAEKGAEVDFTSEVARLNEKLVVDALEKAPSEFTLKARNTVNDCEFISGETIIATTSPGTRSVDLDTWEPKEPTRREFYDYMRIVDALEHIDMPGSFPWAGFKGVPECMRLLEVLAAKIRVSSKGLWEGSITDNYTFNAEMAKAVGIDIWHNTNPASPLTFYKETIDQIRLFSSNDQIFSVTSGPMLGATSPVTLAGSIAINNADILAANAIAQLYRPGTRLFAGGMFMALDMRRGTPVFANASTYLAESAFTQMWRRYGIPSTSNSVGWSNSKMLDYQAAYETTMGAVSMALSGATVLAFAGGLTAELTGHPVKAIIDNDIIGMLKRYLQGIEVNEETLAVDLINDLGFAPTTYMAEMHTAQWYRQESFIPAVADLSSFEAWREGGKKTLIDNARQRMEEILQNHKIEELKPSQEQAIENVLKEARDYYRKNGSISDEEWEAYQKDLSSSDYPFA